MLLKAICLRAQDLPEKGPELFVGTHRSEKSYSRQEERGGCKNNLIISYLQLSALSNTPQTFNKVSFIHKCLECLLFPWGRKAGEVVDARE